VGGKQVGKHPTDRGQIGPTRRVRTDGGGIPIGRAVEGAHRHDFTRARETSASIPIARPAPTPARPQGMGLDNGDDVDEVRDRLAEVGFTAHIRARGEAAQALKQELGVKARRWVVERTHRWMHRFRRVLIRWDKNVCNDLGFLHLACAYITYKQSGLLG
jgi:putative transposase